MPLTMSRVCIINNIFTSNCTFFFMVYNFNFPMSFCVSTLTIINNVFAHHGTFVYFIVYLYVTMTSCIASNTIISYFVSFYIALWRLNSREAIQLHIIGFTIICSIFRMNNFASFSSNYRFSNNIHYSRFGISVCSWRINIVFWCTNYNITIEISIVCFCIVIALIGCNYISTIN